MGLYISHYLCTKFSDAGLFSVDYSYTVHQQVSCEINTSVTKASLILRFRTYLRLPINTSYFFVCMHGSIENDYKIVMGIEKERGILNKLSDILIIRKAQRRDEGVNSWRPMSCVYGRYI